MAFNGGVVVCLRRGIVSNVMSSCKAKREPLFWKYGKQFKFLRQAQDRFGGKVEDMEAGVLGAKGGAAPTV